MSFSVDPNRRMSWREYQAKLQRPRKSARRRQKILAGLALAALVAAISGTWHALKPEKLDPLRSGQSAAVRDLDAITKKDVQMLLAELPADQLIQKRVDLLLKGQPFQVQTFLDETLQSYLLEHMDRKNSRYIGIVVMKADTGQILVLAGFDKTDPTANPCLRSSFPAASIFKIVTAAAAVDQIGYNSDTPLHFNGYKHTLYKRQLKEKINKYTNTISFRDSFAQSVNPVFGKIGILHLQKPVLEQYASAFGFNQPIDFELPVSPSRLLIKNEPYNWAEIASGFNNDTTISPVHAAMMVSAVLNEGRLMAPTVVERIEDPNGKVLYQSRSESHGRAMTGKAAQILAQMMETTVLSGTGRRAFRSLKRDRLFSDLRIGGKTGSISNRANDARFDWFAGFAEDKEAANPLAVAVLVAHEEYIGIRAGEYARMAIASYFKNHLVGKNTGNGKGKS
jgi:cell division protein FtsI/penicillin-binding protein 2